MSANYLEFVCWNLIDLRHERVLEKQKVPLSSAGDMKLFVTSFPGLEIFPRSLKQNNDHMLFVDTYIQIHLFASMA